MHATRYQPYPDYCDSGVEWLGELPAHWDVKRNRYLFEDIDERSITGTETLFSLSKTLGLVPRTEITDKEARADTLIGYKKFQHNDVVMNKMQAWNGMFGYANVPGIISPDYTIFRPIASIAPRYYAYLFTTELYVSQFRWRSRGMGTAFLRLNTPDFNDVLSLLPPLPEQRTIATFLDRETARIDALIEAKRKLIALLEEKRAALISQVVTKGLDPDVPMKDSGIEWLGEIPAHWEIKRIKYLLNNMIDTEHKTAPFYPDGEYLVVRTSNIKNGRLVLNDAKYTDYDGFVEWTQRGVPKPGDILFTREAPAGEACIVPDGDPIVVGQRTVLFRVNQDCLNSQYGVWSLYGGTADEFIKLLSVGSTVPHFNMADIGNIPILVPPLEEQQKIVEHLEAVTSHIDHLIAQIDQGIEKLSEYRTALIAAAVTGKIDVRGEA